MKIKSNALLLELLTLEQEHITFPVVKASKLQKVQLFLTNLNSDSKLKLKMKMSLMIVKVLVVDEEMIVAENSLAIQSNLPEEDKIKDLSPEVMTSLLYEVNDVFVETG